MIRRPPRSPLFPSTTLFRSGQRLRLVIDAYDGDLISRTRLDAPLLPPADVGRERAARIEPFRGGPRSEEHTSELQSRQYLVCRLLLEKQTPQHLTPSQP